MSQQPHFPVRPSASSSATFHTDSSASETDSETQFSEGPLSENEGRERTNRITTNSSSLPHHIAASFSPASSSSTATTSYPFQQFQQPQPSASSLPPSSFEVEPEEDEEKSSLVLNDEDSEPLDSSASSSSSSASFLPGRDPASIQLERERRARVEQERMKHLKRPSLQQQQDDEDLNTTLPPPNLDVEGAAVSSAFFNVASPHRAVALTVDSLAQHTSYTSSAAAFNHATYQHHYLHYSRQQLPSPQPAAARAQDDEELSTCSCTNSYSDDDDYSICNCSVATDSSSEFGTDCSDGEDFMVQEHDALIQFASFIKTHKPAITQGLATLIIGSVIAPWIIWPLMDLWKKNKKQ